MLPSIKEIEKTEGIQATVSRRFIFPIIRVLNSNFLIKKIAGPRLTSSFVCHGLNAIVGFVLMLLTRKVVLN